jgi:hypothetical protein
VERDGNYEIEISTVLHKEIEVSDVDFYRVSDVSDKLTATTFRETFSSWTT